MNPEEKMSALLKLIGNPAVCGRGDLEKGCGAAMIWVHSKTGARLPLNSDGIVHWATCPKAREFKKRQLSGHKPKPGNVSRPAHSQPAQRLQS